MNILILGGNSPRHKQWIRNLGDALTSCGHTVTLHDYHHWETGTDTTDVALELERLIDVTRGMRDYVVIGKSIGAVLSVLGAQKAILRPTKTLLLGTPYDGIARETPSFMNILSTITSATILQNEFDPYGSSASLTDAINANRLHSVKLVTYKGNSTHDYVDYTLIESLITQ